MTVIVEGQSMVMVTVDNDEEPRAVELALSLLELVVIVPVSAVDMLGISEDADIMLDKSPLGVDSSDALPLAVEKLLYKLLDVLESGLVVVVRLVCELYAVDIDVSGL